MAIAVKGGGVFDGTYTFIRDKSSFRKIIARILDRKSMRSDRALVSTLLGAVAGSTATSQLKRVAHSQTELGGLRTIETETLVNRATTAADDTELTTQLLTYNSRNNAYPTDRAEAP